MQLFKDRRGIGGLDNTVISLVVIGFVLIVGMALMQQARDTQTSGSYAYNAGTTVLAAIDDIPGWLGTVVLAVIAVVILGIIYVLRRRSG